MDQLLGGIYNYNCFALGFSGFIDSLLIPFMKGFFFFLKKKLAYLQHSLYLLPVLHIEEKQNVRQTNIMQNAGVFVVWRYKSVL